MTNEENQRCAINYLIELKKSTNGYGAIWLDLAIKVLEQQPCEDTINRKEVLDIITDWFACGNIADGKPTMRLQVKALPSVTPTRPHGKWIEVIDEIDSLGNKTWHYKCSICGNRKSGWGDYKYCPDCGAKMVELQESEG